MSVIDLNLRQKKLLQQLAELKKSKQLIEPFSPFPVDLMNYIVYLRSRYNLRIQWISDLEVLCLAGYLDYEWNRLWTSKKYSVPESTLSILDDKTFLTKEDYKREHPSLTGFDLFIDSTSQPPSNESVNHLLIADLEKVTVALKQAGKDSLSGAALGTVVAEVSFVVTDVMSQSPNKSQIANSVQTIGTLILDQLTQDIELALSGNAVHKSTHTHMIFSLWNKQVSKHLVNSG